MLQRNMDNPAAANRTIVDGMEGKLKQPSDQMSVNDGRGGYATVIRKEAFGDTRRYR
jgi:hypothetical protein